MTSSTATKRKITVRKQPTQERAKAKVEHILASTKTLLIKDGLDKLTTNHIAKAAGMSVGSLYQYFPNKQSVINELFSRWLADVVSLVQELFVVDMSDLTLEAFADVVMAQVYSVEDSGQMQYEIELGKAMLLYPELHEVERLHGEKIAQMTADLLEKMKIKAPRATLVKLGYYIYGLNDLSEQLAWSDKCDRKQSLQWQREAMLALLRMYPS